jgi:hypothetical protein
MVVLEHRFLGFLPLMELLDLILEDTLLVEVEEEDFLQLLLAEQVVEVMENLHQQEELLEQPIPVVEVEEIHELVDLELF